MPIEIIKFICICFLFSGVNSRYKLQLIIKTS